MKKAIYVRERNGKHQQHLKLSEAHYISNMLTENPDWELIVTLCELTKKDYKIIFG